MVRIAVLGCGRIGRMHAANVAGNARTSLAAVFDTHGPSAQEVAGQLGVRAAASAQEIMADATIDAVLIATLTSTHADYIELAVAAGKHVLCEKPIDLSLDRVRQCADRIAASKVAVQLGFNRRFDPGHRSARQALLDGDIGELHQVIITSRDPGMPPRSYYESAGGLFRDMTIHDFDLARFMLGEEPSEVFAIGGRLIDPSLMNELQDDDTAMVIMRTASGKQCHINNSRTSTYGYDQRVELLGTTGMVISGNRKPHELTKFGASAVEVAQPYLNFFIERYREAFHNEITAFVDSIENDTPVQVGFDDGHKALILAEAAMKSAREGRFIKVSEVS